MHIFLDLFYWPNTIQNAGKTKRFSLLIPFPILGTLEFHVQTAVTQKTVYLNLPDQGKDDLTEFYQRGPSFG